LVMPPGSLRLPCTPPRHPLNFTEVPPPSPRARRARRKETIDDLIEGWTTLGLDYFEERYLEEKGYGRWIARRRLTAEMLVELLLLTLEEYEDAAADPVADRATERWRMIEVLRRRRVQGLTDDAAGLLHDLEQLDHRAARRPSPLLQARTTARLRVYEPDDDETARGWAEIRRRHAPVLQGVLREITESVYSTEKMTLGAGKGAAVFEVGEQARLRVEAERLSRELGARFLNPASSMEYRAARVRKWLQLASQRPKHRPPRRVHVIEVPDSRRRS
jgi:hypothetical protein